MYKQGCALARFVGQGVACKAGCYSMPAKRSVKAADRDSDGCCGLAASFSWSLSAACPLEPDDFFRSTLEPAGSTPFPKLSTTASASLTCARPAVCQTAASGPAQGAHDTSQRAACTGSLKGGFALPRAAWLQASSWPGCDPGVRPPQLCRSPGHSTARPCVPGGAVQRRDTRISGRAFKATVVEQAMGT